MPRHHLYGHFRFVLKEHLHGHARRMTSIDFAEAQRRVKERRRLRASEAQARRQSRTSQQTLSASRRLPSPLSTWSQTAINTWDSIKGREGTRPAFRVGQVDAELLDEELLDLLKGQVNEALKYFDAHLQDDWTSEIEFALRALLFKLSIWDHNASYGASLQNLKYTDARYANPIPAAPSRWQKVLYGGFSVGGRYAWAKWENWLLDQQGTYDQVRLFAYLQWLLLTSLAKYQGTSLVSVDFTYIQYPLGRRFCIIPSLPHQWPLPYDTRPDTPSPTSPAIQSDEPTS